MLAIIPLEQMPQARDACIRWSADEWGQSARLSQQDWELEFDRIKTHPVDEIFVALLDGEPVGMAWMLEQEGLDTHTHLTPWLSSVVVDPAHRGKGIAARLIQHVETYASIGGDTSLHLLTESPGIYFSRGWAVLDTAPLFDRHVFVMQKSIAPAA